jgi:Tfp pilus assembly protein PilF
MKVHAFVIALIVAAPAMGDIVHLTDGTKLQGDVKKSPVGYIVTLPGGKMRVIPTDQVKTIELPAPAATMPADSARQKLASMRRSVEYIDDVAKIVERYQRFIEQMIGTAVEADARQDLALWQQRQQNGLVKVGARWVTPAEKEQIREKAIEQSRAARLALKQGRLAEAESLVNQVLSDDPQNPTALYLRGVLQFRQDQLIPARKSFETVNALVANHGPTLNNLGVILARQNQFSPALTFYDQAMMASPRNRDILNNVAEMIYGMPDEARNTTVAARALRRFNEQDEDLVKILSKEGLHRWGATWVTTEQLEQLRRAEREAKDKLDALAAEFDAVKVRISNVDREIEENERAMRRMEAGAYVRDINGTIHQTVLPPLYSELQNDSAKLQRERTEQFARLESLREKAKAVDRELPVPKYSGIQRLMDESNAPVVAPTAPSTKPATTTKAQKAHG